MNAALPQSEKARLEALRQLETLNTEAEEAFARLARLAAHICGTTMSSISLVEHDRQKFKATAGIDLSKVPCQDDLLHFCLKFQEAVVIPDAEADPQYSNNPLVKGYPHVRFYAGVPLLSSAGSAIGTLSVLDADPQHLTPNQTEALQTIGRQIIHQLELQRSLTTIARTTQHFCLTEDSIPLQMGGKLGSLMLTISNRVRAEATLRQGDAHLQLLAQAPNDAVWEWDLAHDIVWWSEGIQTLFGYSIDDIQPNVSWWHDRIHPDDRDRIFSSLNGAISGNEQVWSGEYYYQRADGSFAYVFDRGYIVRDALGKAVRMIGGMTDITERKQVEQKVFEQAALLDVTTDAIFVQDLQHQILFWNKGAERLYGWRADTAIGQTATSLLHPQTSDQLEDVLQTVIAAGEWQGELQQVSQQGRLMTVESRWTLMRDEVGQPKSILVVNTDSTEKKQLESQFLRAQRMESLGTLAGGIAHDLNNVLTPILSSAQLLLMHPTLRDDKKQQLLRTVESSARRGADLVKQVLSFARGVEGKRTVLQIRHLISEIQSIAMETFPRSIELQSNLSDDLWMVSGDATQLHQVFMNLCVNARDAMPNGGKLSFTAANLRIDEHFARLHLDACVGPHVIITVSDTGIGIPPNILERIFEPFFTTKELGRGTGLGLSTVLSIIKSHGGFIDVTSALGRGTQFKIYLPAVQAQEPATVEQGDLFLGAGEVILVVDDETLVCQTTQASLESYNYQVLTANDGIEAIALYAQHRSKIALVLVDIMMPSMDGPMTIRTLRKMNPQVKIIAVSGLACSTQLPETVHSGIQMFLSKPYTTTELLNTIRQVLSST